MAETEVKKPAKKKVPYEEELVKVKFPIIRGEKNQDIVIMINGKGWTIQRGKEVEVPRYVLIAFDNNERGLDEAEKYIMENAYEN